MPLFSVVVPMYNVERYARQCIESILSQTYKDFELILVDDGAKDTTPQIIDEYSNLDNRIIAIHKENNGVTAARKTGVETASGKYIVFVDGDDWIHEGYLNAFVDTVDKYEVEMICCNYFVANESAVEEKRSFVKNAKIEKHIIEKHIYTNLFKFSPHLWAKVFERKLCQKVLNNIPDSVTMGEDGAMVFTILLELKSFYILDKALYYYRYNPQSITNNRKKEWSTQGLLDLVAFLDNNLNQSQYNIENQFVAYVAHMVVNQCLSYFKVNSYFVARKKTRTLLDNELIKKYIYKKATIENKKENLAKFALQHKLFLLLKVYSLMW